MKANIVEANTPAIFRALRTDDIQVNAYTGGYPYKLDGQLVQSSVKEPIYSYAKNYRKFKKDFSLFIWTPESDIKKITKHFEEVLKGVKREDIASIIVSDWQYLQPKYKGDK